MNGSLGPRKHLRLKILKNVQGLTLLGFGAFQTTTAAVHNCNVSLSSPAHTVVHSLSG